MRTEEHKHYAKCSGYCYLKRQFLGGMFTYSCTQEHSIALTFECFSLHRNSQSRHNVSPAFDPGHVLSSALALLLLPRRESVQQPGHRRERSPQPGSFCHEPWGAFCSSDPAYHASLLQTLSHHMRTLKNTRRNCKTAGVAGKGSTSMLVPSVGPISFQLCMWRHCTFLARRFETLLTAGLLLSLNLG